MQPCMMPNIVAILCIMAIKNYYWDIINGHTSTVWVCDFADYLFLPFSTPKHPHMFVSHMTPPTFSVCVCFVVTELVSSNTLLQQAQPASIIIWRCFVICT